VSYQYLTAEDQATIIAEIQAARPTAESVVKAAEAAHFRAVVGAKLGLNDMPDPFVPPDTTDAEREHDELLKPITVTEVKG
jgi:hypothetical protein